MVLADLGSKVALALRKMTQATVIDSTVMNEMLSEICKALLQADVNVAQVRALWPIAVARAPPDVAAPPPRARTWPPPGAGRPVCARCQPLQAVEPDPEHLRAAGEAPT